MAVAPPVEILEERELGEFRGPISPTGRHTPAPPDRRWVLETGPRARVLAELINVVAAVHRRHAQRRHLAQTNPRRHSEVRRHVWTTAPDAAAILNRGLETGIEVPSLYIDEARTVLLGGGRYRIPAAIQVAQWRSSLPCWITILPWWGDRSVLELSLQAPRRVHCSGRYLEVAHDTLALLADRLGLPSQPRHGAGGIRPPSAHAAANGWGSSPMMLARSMTRTSG